MRWTVAWQQKAGISASLLSCEYGEDGTRPDKSRFVAGNRSARIGRSKERSQPVSQANSILRVGRQQDGVAPSRAAPLADILLYAADVRRAVVGVTDASTQFKVYMRGNGGRSG
jgi:hypothetical protein